MGHSPHPAFTPPAPFSSGMRRLILKEEQVGTFVSSLKAGAPRALCHNMASLWILASFPKLRPALGTASTILLYYTTILN